GHGGRYIWRTGPPDLKKNHDLFTLDHLEQLSAGGPLPVVLSLTCYSAPFDHPNADSIGEKLLRLDERGAIAVVAASWRNQPVLLWSEALLEELTRPGATVGEALKAAKRRVNAPMFTATYNLLGDPAVPVARPAGHVEVGASFSDPSPTLQVRGTVELDAFTGWIVVEAVDERGDTVASATLKTDAPAFALDLDLGSADPTTVHAVRVYAWSRSRNVDATGAVELVAAPPSAAERAAWRAERRRQRRANTKRP
ncbi:MAG: hypothetical protein GY856_47280, partial [bacterium]|nr:hypothetical protein [bacterium]